MTLEELYAKQRKGMAHKLYPYLRNPDTAEDLVQEAFLKAFTVLDQYDDKKASLKTWFTKILFSCLWDHMRKAKRVPTTFDIEDVLESEFLSYEVPPNLAPYIETIQNPEHKAILFGYFILGYTPNEISRLFGFRRENVRKIVQRFKERQE